MTNHITLRSFFLWWAQQTQSGIWVDVYDERTPTHADVARSYFGSQKGTRTMTLKLSTAIRLSTDVIENIGDICGKDHPGICLSNNMVDNGATGTVNKVLQCMECNVFRTFVNLTSMRQSTAFVNSRSDSEIQAQIIIVFTRYHSRE